MEKHIMGENGISYTLGEDGLYYPDLYLPEDTEYPIGKYGMLLFFVKYFSLKKASKFPFFSKGFSLPSAGIMHPCA